MTKKNKPLRPPVKTHGGKWYLREFIISHFPEGYEQMTYVEPFCAGASVFLNKSPSALEVIGDIDAGVVAVFKALRDEPKEFIRRVKRIRYTKRVFESAMEKNSQPFEDYMDRAINEYILRRMSRGGLKKTFAWSDRTRGGQPGDVNAWKTMARQLKGIAKRVEASTIVCEDFKDVFKAWDEDNTLFYLDPPYLHSTRAEGSTDLYENELSIDDHLNLLHLAKNARGKVIISGYSSPLYNRSLKNWKCRKKNVANHSAQSTKKQRRIEVLWMNY